MTSREELLTHALERCRTVLSNMALENEGAIFNRWPINHEPLRNDARGLLPVIDAALRSQGGVSGPRQNDLIQKILAEAERYAEIYPRASDGRNTFNMFADFVRTLASQSPSEASSGVEPVAYTNQAQLDYLKIYSGAPMAMWGKSDKKYADIPLYASPPPSASQASCSPPENNAEIIKQARRLINEIASQGTHMTWKGLANALPREAQSGAAK